MSPGPDTAASASASTMASSSASLVPDPTEKWAVWTASPSRATRPSCHRAHRTVGKVRHTEALPITPSPSRWSPNTVSAKASAASSDSPAGPEPVASSPARRQVASSISTTIVDDFSSNG